MLKTVVGSSGGDRLIEHDGLDYLLLAGAGNDLVWSRTGNDKVGLGAGNDSAWTNEGNDLVYGQDGNDTIYGGSGNDWLSGGNGNDLVDGGLGNDALSGGLGGDSLLGGSGDDVLYGSEGNDNWLAGDGGNDLIAGGNGNDGLIGGAGNDDLHGGNGDDWISGDAGNDRIYGGFGNDFIIGETLLADDHAAGANLLYGGLGDDRFVFDFMEVWQDNNTNVPSPDDVRYAEQFGDNVIADFRPGDSLTVVAEYHWSLSGGGDGDDGDSHISFMGSWFDSNSDGVVGAGDTGVSVAGGNLKLDLQAIIPADWTLFGESPTGSITVLGVTELADSSFVEMFL